LRAVIPEEKQVDKCGSLSGGTGNQATGPICRSTVVACPSAWFLRACGKIVPAQSKKPMTSKVIVASVQLGHRYRAAPDKLNVRPSGRFHSIKADLPELSPDSWTAKLP
jgi:hypothetical protein